MQIIRKTKSKHTYICDMCGNSYHDAKYKFKSLLTDTNLDVCRKCAYREVYGTKGMVTAMKENLIEEEKANRQTD